MGLRRGYSNWKISLSRPDMKTSSIRKPKGDPMEIQMPKGRA